MIRDNVLGSDLFVDKIGGPCAGFITTWFVGRNDGREHSNPKRYIMSTDGNQYRRSLTLIGKNSSSPGMVTFDASTRDYCTVERQKTSTPLQSLILLNDPQVQNAAEAIASLILKRESKR